MTNFRPTTLSPEALKVWDEAEANIQASLQRIRELTASVTTQPSDAELDELAWTWYSKTGSTWCQIEAFRAFARAALAHWGRPAPQPVAVSERWPEFSDCDPQERVWAWNPVLDHWKLSRINRSVHTHWLPANALPTPEVTND